MFRRTPVARRLNLDAELVRLLGMSGLLADADGGMSVVLVLGGPGNGYAARFSPRFSRRLIRELHRASVAICDLMDDEDAQSTERQQ